MGFSLPLLCTERHLLVCLCSPNIPSFALCCNRKHGITDRSLTVFFFERGLKRPEAVTHYRWILHWVETYRTSERMPLMRNLYNINTTQSVYLDCTSYDTLGHNRVLDSINLKYFKNLLKSCALYNSH